MCLWKSKMLRVASCLPSTRNSSMSTTSRHISRLYVLDKIFFKHFEARAANVNLKMKLVSLQAQRFDGKPKFRFSNCYAITRECGYSVLFLRLLADHSFRLKNNFLTWFIVLIIDACHCRVLHLLSKTTSTSNCLLLRTYMTMDLPRRASSFIIL